jgi:hypothetical protein
MRNSFAFFACFRIGTLRAIRVDHPYQFCRSIDRSVSFLLRKEIDDSKVTQQRVKETLFLFIDKKFSLR